MHAKIVIFLQSKQCYIGRDPNTEVQQEMLLQLTADSLAELVRDVSDLFHWIRLVVVSLLQTQSQHSLAFRSTCNFHSVES